MLLVGKRVARNGALLDVVCSFAETTLLFCDSSASYSLPAATRPAVNSASWVKTVVASALRGLLWMSTVSQFPIVLFLEFPASSPTITTLIVVPCRRRFASSTLRGDSLCALVSFAFGDRVSKLAHHSDAHW